MRITLTVDYPGKSICLTEQMLQTVIQQKFQNNYGFLDAPIKDSCFNNVQILEIDYKEGNNMIVTHYDKKFDAYYVVDYERNISNDTDWINLFKMERIDFIKRLENYGAFNNAGSYRSRMLFKRERDAWNAIHEFYEPFCLMTRMAM